MKNRLMQVVEDKHRESVKSYSVTDDKGTRDVAREIADFQIGDTVAVHLRILEGQKERTQAYEGVVIAMRGEGLTAMFTVRRIVQGEGVERMFPLYSPKIAKIEVKRTGVVRRAELYYLRDRVGKATRLRERKVNVPGGAAKGKKKKPAAETKTEG